MTFLEKYFIIILYTVVAGESDMFGDLTKVELVERKLDIENARLKLINVTGWGQQTGKRTPITHTHAFTEIFACISGEVTLHTVFGNVTLSKGDVAFFPPKNLHTMDSTEETESTEKYSIGITVQELQGDSESDLFDKFSEVIYGRGISVYRGLPHFAETVKRLHLNDGLDELLILPYFINTVYNAKCELFTSRLQPSEAMSDDIRLVLIEEIINSNYLSEISSESIARRLFISRRQLDRIIFSHFNKTLRALIIEKRIRYGKELLLTTHKTVEEISILTAFHSAKSFGNEFVKEYGITPAQYRKSILKNMEKL